MVGNFAMPAVAFGGRRNLNEIWLKWRDNIHIPTKFNLEISEDGTTWGNLVENLNATAAASSVDKIQKIKIPVNSKYYRIRVLEGNQNIFLVKMYAAIVIPEVARKLDERLLSIQAENNNLKIVNLMQQPFKLLINYLE